MKANRRRKQLAIAVGAIAAVLLAMPTEAATAVNDNPPAGRSPTAATTNDYPTADRADYVIGCMAANGNSQEALSKCSCAIDTIAGVMPYKDYEEAKTALSLQVEGGPRMGIFAHTPQMQALIQNLHQAQAEANIQCFK
ncbi:MAG TPA: hypothetical protein VMQ11_12250 [Alphaproteobacteria bacterium]|nr:hypothetical protein [Alphaproteobacteria bacterium]